MTNKTLAPIGITLVALFGLTACDDTPSGEVTSNGNDSTEEVEEVEEQNEELEEQDEEVEEEAEEMEEETETSSERPTFGDTYTYDDGLAVTIGEPQEFTPGEWSAGGEEFEQHVLFDVTIENNTGEDYDPNMAYVTASSGGSEADSIFDSDAGLDGTSTTTITDGQSTTWQEGFGVNDPADINVEFTDLDFELMRESVLFVSE